MPASTGSRGSAFGLVCLTFAFAAIVDGNPHHLNGSEYAAIHPRLPAVIEVRTSGAGCGSWYMKYSQMHAAVRSGPALAPHIPARYAIMVSNSSGLADRLGCSLTVFLYGLLTKRVFEYMWYGHHNLWDSFHSLWIDWRVPRRDLGLMRKASGGATVWVQENSDSQPGGDGSSSQLTTENHHWSQLGRSTIVADWYIDPGLTRSRRLVNRLFKHGNLLSYGKTHDVILVTLNQGLMQGAFQNPYLRNRLKEVGLTWERATPCIFNYLYVPSSQALVPFLQDGLLDKLLDPNNDIIGIQVRVGDWVFGTQGPDSADAHEDWRYLNYGEGHFKCAEQLTAEMTKAGVTAADGTPRRIYWLLISDSSSLRAAARRRYGNERLLVAKDVPLDHVQDHSFHGQAGLNAAASEMWLFGLASAHIVSQNSAFGRLGALAGGPWIRDPTAPMHRIYGVEQNARRQCRNHQSLESGRVGRCREVVGGHTVSAARSAQALSRGAQVGFSNIEEGGRRHAVRAASEVDD